MEIFYKSYKNFKTYATPILKTKHIRQFDLDFWLPSEARTDMSFLELGCGEGLFLTYLHHKGAKNITGVDHDASLKKFIPPRVQSAFKAQDAVRFLATAARGKKRYDRIILLDVLEHFNPKEGVILLQRMAKILSPEGKIMVRVPNASSPWGLTHQFGDMTHKAAYTPDSMQQVCIASGLTLEKCFGQNEVKLVRRLKQKIGCWLLSNMALKPPAIWQANLIGIITK